MAENWHEVLKYSLWSALFSTILFSWVYYTYIEDMTKDTYQFGIIYAASFATGIIGSLIAMGITGIDVVEKKKWLRIFIAPFIYSLFVYSGIFQEQLAQFALDKPLIDNLTILLYVFLLRLAISFVVRIF